MLGVTDLAKVVVLDQTTAGTTDTAALMAAAMDKMGVREFRYLLPAGYAFATGTVDIAIAQGAVKNADTTDSSGTTVTGAPNIASNPVVHRRGPDRRAHQPRQRRHDRHQRPQRPQLDRRRLRRADLLHRHHCMTIDQQSITSRDRRSSFSAAPGSARSRSTARRPRALVVNVQRDRASPTASGSPAQASTTGTARSRSPSWPTAGPTSWARRRPRGDRSPSASPAPAEPSSPRSTVQVTIPDAGDTGHTAAMLVGYTVDPDLARPRQPHVRHHEPAGR